MTEVEKINLAIEYFEMIKGSIAEYEGMGDAESICDEAIDMLRGNDKDRG